MGDNMNKQDSVNDPIFGRMEYDHSWSKKQAVNWWGEQEVLVEITAQAYNGDDITDLQRESYVEYSGNINNLSLNSKEKLCDFAKRFYDKEYSGTEITNILKPRTVLFHRDGTWGILFDSEFDIENGVALYKNKHGETVVGTQDDFL